MPNKFVNGFCTFLGLFEFFAGKKTWWYLNKVSLDILLPLSTASKFLRNGPDSHEILFQPFTATGATKALMVMFTLTLGLQRLTFSTGDGGVFPWLCLVGTHVFESIFWWAVAVDVGVINTTSVPNLLIRLLTNRSPEDIHLFILLFFVPIIALIFLTSGPSSKHNSEHKKRA